VPGQGRENDTVVTLHRWAPRRVLREASVTKHVSQDPRSDPRLSCHSGFSLPAEGKAAESFLNESTYGVRTLCRCAGMTNRNVTTPAHE
jgi:hypothetical protein